MIFNSSFWLSLMKDAMFLIVSEMIGGALNQGKTKKMEKAVKKIKQNKKKLSYALQKAKINKKTVSIEQKFQALGVGVAFSLNLSDKLISSVATLFIN